eukprot:gnl/Hemi2/8791_TR3048_c0_g1_i1.p1 gnl/Hemi2/8791_TR3048_c0_g1~~gnl/Hemi2/8791_TR3048_c0_g1_i1.p1  ORF type:complete len:193 (-),score=31.07 gnl/Hemi2/8791_TR3048_c0_g1_i1:43-621(-)
MVLSWCKGAIFVCLIVLVAADQVVVDHTAGQTQSGVSQSNSALLKEATFLMIKPDGVQRGLIGNIISRFERKGYQLVAMKTVLPSKPLVSTHYLEHAARDFFPDLVAYVCSGPVVAMVWEGPDVVAAARKMIGATNPVNADPGTIRGEFATSKQRNIIHGSDSAESAMREIQLWFSHAELGHWSFWKAPSQS